MLLIVSSPKSYSDQMQVKGAVKVFILLTIYLIEFQLRFKNINVMESIYF